MAFLTDLFEDSRPAQIRRYREKYNDYRTKTETESGEPAKKFEDWLREQGIDPEKLLGT